jgi:hypothetical protein
MSTPRRLILATAVGALAAAAVAVPAQAATYPTQSDSVHFRTSPGGWTKTVTYGTSCPLPGITCALGQGSWVASGGSGGAGDGYLHSKFTTVAGIAADVTVSWTSPAFTLPAGAAKPGLATFQFRGNAGTLVNFGGGAGMTYRLQDVTRPSGSFDAIRTFSIPHNKTFGPLSRALPNYAFHPGDTYRIVLSGRVTTPKLSIPLTGTLDYDDVALITG